MVLVKPIRALAALAYSGIAFATLAGPPVMQEDFESGAPGWTIDNTTFGPGNGLWAITDACSAADPGHTGPLAAIFADPKLACTCTLAARAGTLTSPTVALPAIAKGDNLVLRFRTNLQTECDPGYDHVRVEVTPDGQKPVLVASNKARGGAQLADYAYGGGLPAPVWSEVAVNLDAFAGQSVSLRFTFNTYDDFSNDVSVGVDDVVIAVEPAVAPPQIVGSPVSVDAETGALIEFTVKVEGEPPFWFRWTRDGEGFPSACSAVTGGDTATLRIVDTRLYRCGEYRVEVYNAGGMTLSDPAVLSLRCRADINADCVVNSTDVSDFINFWFVDQVEGGVVTDFNGDGVSNSTDVSDYINEWFLRSPWC